MTRPIGPTSRPPANPSGDQGPTGAAVAVAVGGFFVLVEGILFAEYYLVFTGFFLFVLALLVRYEPHHHVANGVMVFVLVFMSVYFGAGGFYIGALLAAIGGTLAIVWKPRRVTGPVSVKR